MRTLSNREDHWAARIGALVALGAAFYVSVMLWCVLLSLLGGWTAQGVLR